MPAQHRDLLRVLLAEVGAIGTDDREELQADRGDAAEVAGPVLRPRGSSRAPSTSTHVWKPGGYISLADGAKTTSTPSSAATPRSRASSRG